MTDVAEYLERVEKLAPLISEHAPRAESLRRLTPEVYQAMRDAELFAIVTPAAYGGADLDPLDALQVWERLGRYDPSVAWVALMNATFAAFTAWLPTEGTDEIFADGPVPIAGALNPPAPARRVDGGWRLTGQVSYASGCDYADWVVVPGVEMEGEGPKVDPETGEPRPLVMLLPRSAVTVVDTWHTLGMRGTGSADVRFVDAFVPDHLCYPIGPLTSPNPAFDQVAARMFPMLSVAGEAMVSVAAAARMVDEIVALAQHKNPGYTAITLRDRELAQYQAARARAHVEAARDTLRASCAEAVADASTGSLLGTESKIRVQLAASFAAEAAAEAGRDVHAAAGSTSIRTEYLFERLFRDLHTLSQHASKALPRYASVGRMMFGLDSGWIFLSF
ncbi:MAG: acyl-CoA dehydrogenase family protein [Acidimicrobiia bacterium]|nr:acyl-CoA dehydrogenase family protein [Acidimicrobiia bacterium]MDH5290700.1 acyl-CoA dehydrogenase family protein [Acidimicrobiia bacterium]